MRTPPYKTKSGLEIGIAYIPPNKTNVDEYDEQIQRGLLGLKKPWHECLGVIYSYLVLILIICGMIRVFTN
jgi:hypothetical protein